MDFSLGLIEVEALGHAIFVIDAMTKAADVEFVATERKLGGRLVTLVVRGSVSAVTAAIDAGKEMATQLGCLKAAEVIARPHREIFKFLHLEEPAEEVKKQEEKIEKPVKSTATKTVSKAAKTASDKKTTSKRGTTKKA